MQSHHFLPSLFLLQNRRRPYMDKPRSGVIRHSTRSAADYFAARKVSVAGAAGNGVGLRRFAVYSLRKLFFPVISATRQKAAGQPKAGFAKQNSAQPNKAGIQVFRVSRRRHGFPLARE
jgi:hypothetical protein